MEAAIQLSGVTKTFGKVTAVDRLDLTVPRGAMYGFIGPNGAGKSTSIRMIMSILFPDSGELSVLGHRSALDAKDRIGYLPEERGVYKKMRVSAFLMYIARLKGLHDAGLRTRISEALERVGLDGVERKRCDELSKGMSQKVQLIAAIIHKPDLLILDEPFSGLDPVSMRTLRDLILEENRRGATILFSTHVMPQAEEICDHVVMIHKGRKVLDDDVREIRRQYDPRVVQLEPLDAGMDPSKLPALPEIERVEQVDHRFRILLREGADPQAVMRRLLETIPAARIELARPRLEDVFVRLVGGTS